MLSLPNLDISQHFRRIAVLTSGGDCPGMNPAIRAVTRAALNQGIQQVFGVNHGYQGLLDGDFRELSSRSVSNTIQRGGTFLKSARCSAFTEAKYRQQAADNLRSQGIEALVVIGGDGSLTGAKLLGEETNFPVIGLPGTIDNDIAGTDDTIGFDTAVNTALEAVDKIRDTALSHERLFLVEVMGRNSGFIATQVGIACGAEMVIVPEYDFNLQDICQTLARSHAEGQGSSGIIVVAEGDDPGLTQRLGYQLEQLGHPPRMCILGHIQRGGSPSGHDRVLASCLGAAAVSYLQAGFRHVMIGTDKGDIIATPLTTVVEQKRQLDRRLYDITTLLHK